VTTATLPASFFVMLLLITLFFLGLLFLFGYYLLLE